MSVSVIERPLGYVLGDCVDATIDEQYGGYATVNKVAHGLSDGDYVYISSNVESYSGFWYVNIEGTDYFKIRRYATAEDQSFIVNADIEYCPAESTHGWNCVHLPITYRLKSDLALGGITIVTDTLNNLFTTASQEATGNEDWTADVRDKATVNLIGNENSEIIGFQYSFTAGTVYNFSQFTRFNQNGGAATVTLEVRLYGSFGGGVFSNLRGSYSYQIVDEYGLKQFSLTPSNTASYIAFYVTQNGISADNQITINQTQISTQVASPSTITINSFNNDNGYTNINLSGSIDSGSYPEPYEYIQIVGGDMEGVYQIIEVVSSTSLTLNLVYDSSYVFGSGTVSRYYNNYNIIVRVYGGLESGHTWELQKPYELLATLNLIPDTNGEVFFSINEILKSQVFIKNNLTLDTLPNNIDAFTQFYISIAESYDDSLGSQYILSTYTSDFTDDPFEGVAVNSKLPFKNIHSGSMSDYVGGSKFLTLFTAIEKYDVYQDLSILITDNHNDYELDISGSKTAIEAYDKGVYRIPITTSGVYSIYKAGVQVSNEIVVTDAECSNQVIYLSWLNYLGAMEPAFGFTAEKDNNIEIEETGETMQNTFVNWPRSYGSTADTIKKQTFRKARKSKLIRSQYLTSQQLEAIQYIKTSPLVQIIESRTDRRTVLVDEDSFTVSKDNQDLLEISFTIFFTDEIPSQS